MDVQRDGFGIAKQKTIAVDWIKALDVLPVRRLVGRHGAALDSLKNKPVKLANFVEVKIIEHPDVQYRFLPYLDDCGHLDEVRLILLFKFGASKQVVPGRVMKSEHGTSDRIDTVKFERGNRTTYQRWYDMRCDQQ